LWSSTDDISYKCTFTPTALFSKAKQWG